MRPSTPRPDQTQHPRILVQRFFHEIQHLQTQHPSTPASLLVGEKIYRGSKDRPSLATACKVLPQGEWEVEDETGLRASPATPAPPPAVSTRISVD